MFRAMTPHLVKNRVFPRAVSFAWVVGLEFLPTVGKSAGSGEHAATVSQYVLHVNRNFRFACGNSTSAGPKKRNFRRAQRRKGEEEEEETTEEEERT
jgi:hypothetical protein